MIADLHTTLVKSGGFTVRYDLDGNELPGPQIGDHKFAVAYSKTTEQVYQLDQLTISDLVNYIVDHSTELSRAGVHLGGWVDGGKVYLDCSIVVNDLAVAIEIAERNDQLAIFCFEDCTTKFVNKVAA